MSEFKGTRGEWRVSGTSIITDEFCIAVIEDDGGYEAPSDQREANVQLLSAASDLLEACQAAYAVIHHLDDCYGAPMEQLRLAIAKATGEGM